MKTDKCKDITIHLQVLDLLKDIEYYTKLRNISSGDNNILKILKILDNQLEQIYDKFI